MAYTSNISRGRFIIIPKRSLDTEWFLKKAETNPKLAQDVNVFGTVNMLHIALHQNLINKIITKFFFPSSIAVYHTKRVKYKEQHIKENTVSSGRS